MKSSWIGSLAFVVVLANLFQPSLQNPEALITSLSQLPQADQLDWVLRYLEENSDVNPKIRSLYKNYIDRLVSRVMKKRAPEEPAYFEDDRRPIMTDIRMKKSAQFHSNPLSAIRIRRATDYKFPLSDIRLRKRNFFTDSVPLSAVRIKKTLPEMGYRPVYGFRPLLSDIRIKKDFMEESPHIVPLSDIRLKKKTIDFQDGVKRNAVMDLSDVRMKKENMDSGSAETYSEDPVTAIFDQLVETYPYWAHRSNQE
ncbi:hypothetical protein TCAL_09279 [Tigriopus californicus]|uniref:Uncharacterized protein n=1 Tax=Tigriopus californicus TaxID=6832 RepID=A0A553PT08_TIGCA|nr:hypothetical protein TCAL_09279 [Tigriopus californicus]|eukprot:TCALIF_09279-PA protein Name:"Protein of unknown function" AED:0.00 eAED:0.00 QI:132/1/1/1/0.25/0.4/5/515/253